MSEQQDMDATEAELGEQRQWGEPQWLRAMERLTSAINSARSRMDGINDRVSATRDDLQTLRARVKALEDRVP